MPLAMCITLGLMLLIAVGGTLMSKMQPSYMSDAGMILGVNETSNSDEISWLVDSGAS